MRIRSIPAATLLTMVGLAGGTAGVAIGIHVVEAVPAKTANVRTISDTESATPSVSDTPTPTTSSTPEGDDGSLGGPVYNSANQSTPTYIYKSPAPTHEDANDDTAEVATPTAEVTHTATSEVTEKAPKGMTPSYQPPDEVVEPAPASSVPTEESSATATG